jgi:sugar lactone lactonase YvrE
LALLLLLVSNVARAQNTISTVAGSVPPNNVAPTAAAIEGPQAVARDSSGNLYVVNDNGVIYKVTPGTPSSMSIYAGNNTAGFSSNGTLATSALLYEPTGAALDASGNLYFSDQNNCVVREIVAASGVINTVAGVAGQCGYNGDGIAATSAFLYFPQGVALDGAGNLYIADIFNEAVRRVDSSGTITTYAGTATKAGYSGDTGAATAALLNSPIAVAFDTNGDLFIADQNNNAIRRVDATSKVITTVAGSGPNNQGYSGDGGPATAATLNLPDGVAVDSAGNIYISDTDNAAVREVFSATNPTKPNQITTIVGNHKYGFNGDGNVGTATALTNP